MDKIYIAKSGCPLCKSDIIGNREIKYYCKRCSVLFSEDVVVKKELFIEIKKFE